MLARRVCVLSVLLAKDLTGFRHLVLIKRVTFKGNIIIILIVTLWRVKRPIGTIWVGLLEETLGIRGGGGRTWESVTLG
jgi:hypothetical protein